MLELIYILIFLIQINICLVALIIKCSMFKFQINQILTFFIQDFIFINSNIVRRNSGHKGKSHHPTKMVIPTGDLPPYSTDPVEIRRQTFQTPGC